MKILKNRVEQILTVKDHVLIYLIIVLGVCIPTFSGLASENFWVRLYSINTTPIYLTMFYLSTGLFTMYSIKNYCLEYNILIRNTNYKQMIDDSLKVIIFGTIFLNIIGLLLTIAGAVIFCYNDFSVISHPIYNISFISYMLFFALRGLTISCIINVTLYLLYMLFKDYANIILIAICSSFTALPSKSVKILHFYNMPLLFHNYYFNIEYSTFYLEILCSTIETLLLIGICKLLYYFAIKKKRDII